MKSKPVAMEETLKNTSHGHSGLVNCSDRVKLDTISEETRSPALKPRHSKRKMDHEPEKAEKEEPEKEEKGQEEDYDEDDEEGIFLEERIEYEDPKDGYDSDSSVHQKEEVKHIIKKNAKGDIIGVE
ncbi:hypothetical protein RFI_11011 [Reticulomyxa filosa]|uniref:Uncharacterized protein n=1 Tax=Reticulomyxa filosa TaxID=46433 RepID=X6NJN1_RETFI|nr:hypothetical protein RFI_11011 [Reticulomyxa filosa]|eukprot:ETO26128.1 hypothetical protein RFI_11011 [Reticulomyxa filosa]